MSFDCKKLILDISLLLFQFIMSQSVYQISCICQHKVVRRHQVFRFQRIYAKHFNVKNQMKQIFTTICNMYCIIQCKVQMNCWDTFINCSNAIVLNISCFNETTIMSKNNRLRFIWHDREVIYIKVLVEIRHD